MLCNKYPVPRQREIVQIQLLGLLIYLFYVNVDFKTTLNQSEKQNVQPGLLLYVLVYTADHFFCIALITQIRVGMSGLNCANNLHSRSTFTLNAG